MLVDFFAKKYAHLSPLGNVTFCPRLIEAISAYDWPGNVRGLENYIKRCVINATEPVIVDTPVPEALRYPFSAGTSAAGEEQWKEAKKLAVEGQRWKAAKKHAMADFEFRCLQHLLSQYHGVVAHCARHAGILPSDFW